MASNDKQSCPSTWTDKAILEEHSKMMKDFDWSKFPVVKYQNLFAYCPPSGRGHTHKHKPKYPTMSEAKLKKTAKAEGALATDPLEKLRSHCLSKGYSGILSLGRMFRRLDKDHSWTLSKEEMSRGVSQFGLDLSQADIDKLFAAFDKDGKAGINYEEFLEALRPGLNATRKTTVEKVFKYLDKTGDGVVTVEDLKGVYCAKNHPKVKKGEATEEDLLKKFLNMFETNGSIDGKVTKQEFFDYYSGLSKSIDDDEYFVSVVNMSWGL